MRHPRPQVRLCAAVAPEPKGRVTQSDEPGRSGPFTFDVGLLADDKVDSEVREREWMRVYKHFDPRLRDYFSARVRDGDELDDLLALLWRRALRGLRDLRHPGGAWNWLVRVGLNALRDGWRRDTVRVERHNEWLNEQLAEGEPLVELTLEEDDESGGAKPDSSQPIDASAVRAALEHLSTNDQAVLRLRLFEQLDHAEIAARLGLPSAAAARQRFSRAKAQLQRILTSERTTGRSRKSPQQKTDTPRVPGPRARSRRGRDDA